MLESVALAPDKSSLTRSQKEAEEAWGLTALFEAPKVAAKGRNIFYVPTRRVSPPRIMDVSDLFQQNTGVSDKSAPVIEVPVDSVGSSKQQSEMQERIKPATKVVKVSNRLRRR
jgi:hypothetical protein